MGQGRHPLRSISVLKFQVDCTCFQRGEASENSGVKVGARRGKE